MNLRGEFVRYFPTDLPRTPYRRSSQNSPTRRFVEKDLGATQDSIVDVHSDAALLPQDLEFVGAVSQRHPEAQIRA